MSDPIDITVAAVTPTAVTMTAVPVIDITASSERGLQGLPGPGLDDVLSVAGRLGEFDTAQARAEARENLDLQTIDLGTFN